MPSPAPSVVVLVADGARPDALRAAIDGGALPAMAALAAEGGLHTVSTVFPSVTGPAYAPFLMGRFPGPVGLPALRWFDRARTRCLPPDWTRSYVGHQMRLLDADLAPDAPTIFELVPDSVAALNVIGRGLAPANRLAELTLRSAFRAATTHFRGNVRGWLDIDREVADALVARVRAERPTFAFAALTGVDKSSHAAGHADAAVHEALGIVDDTVRRLRADAERDGRWPAMQLWIVSDHGHSPVTRHEDLAGFVAGLGFRAMAHPWVFVPRPEVAVMVSGNAMAHLYLDLPRRQRPWWPALADRWGGLRDALLARDSVDLVLLPLGETRTAVHARGRGGAVVERVPVAGAGSGALAWRYRYEPLDGDPLGLGGPLDVDATEAHDRCATTDYPDALVQVAHLAGASRSGEIILSAARDWDFRAKWEPIPHVSSHGALHREHMLVPLLVNHPLARAPRRTTDVFPSALAALGVGVPPELDGASFL